MPNYLKLTGFAILIVGLISSALLVTQTQLFKNKAFIPGPVTSSKNLYLSPLSATVSPNSTDIVPFNLSIKTPEPISSVATKITFPYQLVNNTPNIQVVTAGGSQSSQLFPNSQLQNSSEWLFPVNSVTYSSGVATIEFAAINTSPTGVLSSQDLVIATVYLKIDTTYSPSSTLLTFDTQESRLISKISAQNIADPNLTTAIYIGTTTPTCPSTYPCNPTPTQGQQSPTPLPNNATITFSPSSGQLNPNSDNLITATLNTNNQKIDGFQIVATFTSNNITIANNQITLASLPGITCPTNNVNTSTNTITIGCITSNPNSPYSNNSNTNILNFNLKTNSNAGSFNLSFNNSATKVTNSTGNILQPLSELDYTSQSTGNSTSQASFKIKLQGISTQRPDRSVRLTLRQTGQPDIVMSGIPIVSDASGIYTTSPVSVAPGTYDVLVKGPVHLQKKFTNIIIPSTTTSVSLDLTSTPLRAGDTTGNNTVDVFDYNLLAKDYEIGVTKSSIADLNLDNRVDIFDFNLLAGNFNIGIYGDQ